MAVRVSEDIVPIGEFKAHAPEWFKRAAKSRQPVVITQNGKAAGVLFSPLEYDRLTEHQRFVQGVKEGLADADAGRLIDHDVVVTQMKKRFGHRKS